MPPPKIAQRAPPASKALVPVRPQGKRGPDGQKPSTARALVLRNGKYGARGTQEVVLAGRMSGREKLDLLAEDLMKEAQTALGVNFRLEQCLKIAESQLNFHLDEIKALRDPELFEYKIDAEINARTLIANRDRLKENPDYVASVVASRIHNIYMLASAWKLIRDTLRGFDEEGIDDSTIRAQLKTRRQLRSRFLVLYDIVQTVSEAYQANFALLATTTAHYAPYFKQTDSDGDEPEFVFDWASLRSVHKSFLDSIIVELCLPQSSYPKNILYRILESAIDESPRDAKLFPQGLWDALGDLRVIVQLQELIESPLLGADRKDWLSSPRQMPEDFEQWVDAQIFSDKASKDYANYKDLIYPLKKTSDEHVLEAMWNLVDVSYEAVSGRTIDDLWQLSDVLDRTPQWHAVYESDSDSDSDDDGPPGLSPIKYTGKKGSTAGQRLAITADDADGNETDGSMPSLQTVSDTSEETDSDFSSDDQASEWEDDESGYDTDEEEMYREMLREAMDTVTADSEFLNTKKKESKFDALAEEMKNNPFLKLLGSLRGRMFSANPTLKTTLRTEPRQPNAMGRSEKQPSAQTESAQSLEEIVEDAEDDGDADTSASPKKKKKKKPKKKRKSVSVISDADIAAASSPTLIPPLSPSVSPERALERETQQPASPSPNKAPQTPEKLQKSPQMPAKSPQTPAKLQTPEKPQTPEKLQTPEKSQTPEKPQTPVKPQAPVKPQTPAKAKPPSPIIMPNMSTTSLPLPHEQVAQSAHKYLKSEGLTGAGKSKIKSRPDFPTLVPIPDNKKKGIFGKFGNKKDKDKDKVPQSDGEDVKRSNTWFKKLSKKAKPLMHQLLRTSDDEKKGTGSMKWEHFLRVMREMGFSYDPSTAGSSVRFDPPSPLDPPITFHKPHPDSTLYPVKLKEFGKKLKDYYGWSEEEFYRLAAL